VAAGILSPKALEGGYCRRVPDAIFAHPRLAPIYDVFDGDRDDLAAYLSIADELGADRVLDVGCGTGCLAVLLAASGRIVVGVDPAGASLEVAKSKDATRRITWVHGDATAAPPSGADLAVSRVPVKGAGHGRAHRPPFSGAVRGGPAATNSAVRVGLCCVPWVTDEPG
jgi:SAM-dependent methyltransferase